MGAVYWITGLSGAGKTTIGKIVYGKLKERYPNTVFLDGDILRQVFDEDLGYEKEDRRQCAMHYSRLCAMLAEQGINVVCCTISMFHSVRQWNRANIHNYREIYIKVSWETLQKRDTKGIYGNLNYSDKSPLANQLGYEEPLQPDLTLQNDGQISPEEQAQAILSHIYRH